MSVKGPHSHSQNLWHAGVYNTTGRLRVHSASSWQRLERFHEPFSKPTLRPQGASDGNIHQQLNERETPLPVTMDSHPSETEVTFSAYWVEWTHPHWSDLLPSFQGFSFQYQLLPACRHMQNMKEARLNVYWAKELQSKFFSDKIPTQPSSSATLF